MIFPLLLLVLSTSAQALDFTEFLTGNVNFPTLASHTDTSIRAVPSLSWGAGMTIGFHVYPQVFFEVGLIYTSRNFSQRSGSTPPLEYALTWIQLPIVARYWFDKKLSVAGGMYLSQAVGNVNFTLSDQKTVLGYDQNGWSRNDVGFTASFRYRTPLNELLFFVADERVNWGLSQVNITGRGSFRIYEFQSWVGVSVDL